MGSASKRPACRRCQNPISASGEFSFFSARSALLLAGPTRLTYPVWELRKTAPKYQNNLIKLLTNTSIFLRLNCFVAHFHSPENYFTATTAITSTSSCSPSPAHVMDWANPASLLPTSTCITQQQAMGMSSDSSEHPIWLQKGKSKWKRCILINAALSPGEPETTRNKMPIFYILRNHRSRGRLRNI